MRKVDAIVLIAITPLLLATDSFLTPDGRPPPSVDKRQALERYNYEIDNIIEAQIEKISTLDPSSKLKRLREAHYSWKLRRDLRCAENGRLSSDRFAELECRAAAAEDYYEELEARIAALENPNDSR